VWRFQAVSAPPPPRKDGVPINEGILTNLIPSEGISNG
jgi:hypothetical protein